MQTGEQLFRHMLLCTCIDSVVCIKLLLTHFIFEKQPSKFLEVPTSNTKYGENPFSCIAPLLWHSLSDYLRYVNSLKQQ